MFFSHHQRPYLCLLLLRALRYCFVLPLGLAMAEAQATTQSFHAAENRAGETTEGPQPCPVNPIRLVAKNTPQYISSPYDMGSHLYLPNTDCRFLLRASSRHHRIQLTILRSELEEPLFGQCNDYLDLRDGNGSSSRQIAKWCGLDSPTSVTSSANALYLHFHTDGVVQKHGFNISFVEFELSLHACPPNNWLLADTGANNGGESSRFCIKLFPYDTEDSNFNGGSTWFEAQRRCNYERANLLTFRDADAYDFVIDAYANLYPTTDASSTAADPSHPWIGYSDASSEGVFETADKSSTLWPEKFPTLAQMQSNSTRHTQNKQRNCLFLDWGRKEQKQPTATTAAAYASDDCRRRRSFLCAKLSDGSTTPVFLATNFMRSSDSSHHSAGISLLSWLLIILLALLLLLLLVLCPLLCWWRYKKRKSNRIANVDQNQRLVVGLTPSSQPAQPDLPAMEHGLDARSKTNLSSEAGTHREKAERLSSVRSGVAPSKGEHSAVGDGRNAVGKVEPIHAAGADEEERDYPLESPRIRMTPNQPGVFPFGVRETVITHSPMREEHYNSTMEEAATVVPNMTVDDSTGRISHVAALSALPSQRSASSKRTRRDRMKRKGDFSRPRVKALESVSAISLDEFWRK